MDDDMFSMLNKTKKVKKSKTAAGQAPVKASATKRRNRSGSEESNFESPPAEDGPSERKKARVEEAIELDPMEALEKTAGNDTIGDETMEDLGSRDPEIGDVSVDVAPASESSKAMPVVTDDFEQEAEREVAATSGFAKVEEGEKMRLVHQVRHQVSISSLVSLPSCD
jgi:hypothetical protein